jgi:membrane protease YdiL (CAAX protease family)
MPKINQNVNLIKNVTSYSAYLLVIWVFYRFLFKFPDEVEELVIKPVLWLLPLFYFVFKKEQARLASIGFTLKNFFPAIYFAIGLGSIFVIEGLITNYLKYGQLNFGANLGNLPFMTSLGLSFATAFTEETAFRGYIFSRLWIASKNEWTANAITTVLWTAIHSPIAFYVWKLDLSAGIIYLVLTAIFGFGSSFVFARTRNIISSILLHVLWQWPIILFR